MRPRSDVLPPLLSLLSHGRRVVVDVGPTATEPEPDPVITTTDDFEVDDDTTTTDQLYQEYYANLYALGFRLVVS